MHTQHCVSVHVLPEDTLALMPYYTHHKQMGTQHYQFVVVLLL